MAYSVTLKAGGTTLPGPKEMSTGDELLWSSNAGRSPDTGKMIGDVVARKKTVDVTWQWLTRAEFESLKSAVNQSAYFNFKIILTQGTSTITDTDMTVYQGGISSDAHGFAGGAFYYKSVKISFVQQ